MIDKCQIELNLTGKIATRKAWGVVLAAEDRAAVDREAARRAPDNAPITESDAKNLHDLFFHRHSFKIPTTRLLHDDIMGKMRSDWRSVPSA